MTSLFVTGIGTGIGKTLISAILCEALKADYWKPVQAGNLEDSDSDFVKKFTDNSHTIIHPEAFRLTTACSPHLAAKIDNVEIELSEITAPKITKPLIVEGAGGLLVPLNEHKLVIDLIEQFKMPVVLVSQNYLGSINHTLLSIEALRAREIPIAGIVFNGSQNLETEHIINSFFKLPVIGRVFKEAGINRALIQKYATEFGKRIHELS